jgi:AraC-like DNA-binding protein
MAITKDYACIPVECRDQHLPMVPTYAEPFRKHNIRGVGIHEVVKPYEIQRLTAPWHLAIFTYKGQAKYSCRGRSGLIKENSVWIGPADTPYQYSALEDWHFISVALIKGDNRLHFEQGNIYKSLSQDICHLKNSVEAYFSESTHCQSNSSPAAASLAEYISLFINRALEPEEKYETSRNTLHMHKVWEVVNSSPGASWSILDLADEMNMSIRQFQRMMKKTYTITAEQMLTKIRMQRAQELLVSTDMTLESIGHVVGYQSVYSFSKAFKNFIKDSPGAYRTKNRELF